jgi:hypothetical protein
MPSEASAKEGCPEMHYVYLLESEAVAGERYVGATSDLSSDWRSTTPESLRTRPNTLLGGS